MQQYLTGSREYNTPERPVAAPLFRRRFRWDGADGRVVLRLSAVGFYRLFLNGRELTKGYFAPYISNPNDFVYYDEYEPDGVLRAGDNELCVLLGNGFSNALDNGIWDFESASFRAAPKFALEITRDGEIILCTDERFEVCDSPIMFDDLRCGERYDARRESEGPGGLFTGVNVRKPLFAPAPAGAERLCGAQPIRAFETIRPVAVTRTDGGYIYDFGVNFAGIYELNIDGRDGQRIDLTFGEVLQDGQLDLSSISFDRSREGYVQHDVYICRAGRQSWRPSFTYHGYRYAFVEGLDEAQATADLLTYVVVHSDVPARGRFSCSDETLNAIQTCTLRSDLSNFHYYPTDCPHREKNGWTGDVHLSAEQLLYNFDCAPSLAEWLVNICAAQKPSGALPGIIPTDGWGFAWGNGPAWDGVIIELPYRLYTMDGNRQCAADAAPAIARYVGYLETKKKENGLIGFGLGDWCETGTLTEGQYATPEEVTDSLVCIDLLRKAAVLFDALGDRDNADRARKLEQELTAAFKAKRIAGYAVDCRTQTAQAMAIQLGLFDDDRAAYGVLRELIRAADDRFKVGVIGAKWLFDCLCDHDDCDLAYELAADARFPSYAYNIAHGATSLWESFDEYDERLFPARLVRADGEQHIPSFNHHFWGSISAWFYRRVAGLTVTAADEADVSPCYIAALTHAEAEFKAGERRIAVRWERVGDKIALTVDNRGYRGFVTAGGRQPLKEGKHTYTV